MKLTPEESSRFWAKVQFDTPSGCFDWKRGQTSAGYGVFQLRQKFTLAHRLVFIITHGPIENGMFVRHSCDRPCCVNPFHLDIGTPRDNTLDMMDRGRNFVAHGSAHGRSTLNETKVLHIRQLASQRIPLKDIAVVYGVNASMISRIVARKNWKHI